MALENRGQVIGCLSHMERWFAICHGAIAASALLGRGWWGPVVDPGAPIALRVPNNQYGDTHCSRRGLGFPTPHASLLSIPTAGLTPAAPGLGALGSPGTF